MLPLLKVDGLVKHFAVRRGAFGLVSGHVHAVDGVDFHVAAGETLAIVGESGCGKSTVGRLVLRLIEPTSGQVRFEGEDLLAFSEADLRARRRRMQLIFQDPYASLNPRMTVGTMLGEPLMLHGLARREGERRARVGELLDSGRPAARPCPAISARILRWSTPAARHRPRPRFRAQADRGGRAGVGARRLDPGASHQPDALLAASLRLGLRLHQPRSRGREAHRRPHRRNVPRQDRGDGDDRGTVPCPAASLHPGAARRGAASRSGRSTRADASRGRHPERPQSTVRLPVPHAMSIRAEKVHWAGARACRRWHGPCYRLSPLVGIPAALELAGAPGKDDDRLRLERLQAAFMSDGRETS